MEDVQRQLFGGLPVVGDPHDQGEYDSMRAFVQRMQRMLVALGDGLDEPDPLLLPYEDLRFAGVEHIADEFHSCSHSGSARCVASRSQTAIVPPLLIAGKAWPLTKSTSGRSSSQAAKHRM